MVFNLIPLPPLDGEEILLYLLPYEWQRKWESFRPYGPYLLFFLLLVGPLIGFSLVNSILAPIVVGLANLLMGGL
jgi:Zn-dependent protease